MCDTADTCMVVVVYMCCVVQFNSLLNLLWQNVVIQYRYSIDRQATGSVRCGPNPKYPPKAVNWCVFGRNNEFESDSFCASNPIGQQLAIRKFWEYLRVISTRLSHRKQTNTKKKYFFQIFDNVKIHLMTPPSITSNIYTVHTTGYLAIGHHSPWWTVVPLHRCGSWKM